MKHDDLYIPRVRQLMDKCRRFGFRSLTHDEAIELFLCLSSNKSDAGALFDYYKSGESLAIFDSSETTLKKHGAFEQEAFLLAHFHEIVNYIMKRSSIMSYTPTPNAQREELANEQRLVLERIIVSSFIGMEKERALLLLFDKDARLIYNGFVTMSSNMSVVINIEQVCALACQKQAYYALLAHNHPSGSCEPSEHDLMATVDLYRALLNVGVHLADHYIVTQNECRSIREHFDFTLFS